MDKRRNHHNSESIILALPLASEIQNDILKIKYFNTPIGYSKEYIKNLRNEIVTTGGNVFSLLLSADNTRDNNSKLEYLESAYNQASLLIQYINQIAIINSLNSRKAMNIATKIHTLLLKINKWKKFVLNKQK